MWSTFGVKLNYIVIFEKSCNSSTLFMICDLLQNNNKSTRKKYTSGPRYWNVPVLVNTGTFLVYQYCLKMWYLRHLERASVIQKLTILERKNGLVLANTRVPVSGTWSILFPSTLSPPKRSGCSNAPPTTRQLKHGLVMINPLY